MKHVLHCPNCFKEIDAKAKTCDYCGYSIEEYRQNLLRNSSKSFASRTINSSDEQKNGSAFNMSNKNLQSCPDCGNMVSKSAESCPHCGHPFNAFYNAGSNGSNKENSPSVGSIIKRMFAFVISILLIITALSYLSGFFNKGKNESQNNGTASDTSRQNIVQAINNTVSDYRLKVVTAPHLVKQEYGNIVIEGKLENTSGRTLSYAQITFALYDKDGAQIGSAIDNINNLTDGAVWKYTAIPLTTEKWTDFKQTEVESW